MGQRGLAASAGGVGGNRTAGVAAGGWAAWGWVWAIAGAASIAIETTRILNGKVMTSSLQGAGPNQRRTQVPVALNAMAKKAPASRPKTRAEHSPVASA